MAHPDRIHLKPRDHRNDELFAQWERENKRERQRIKLGNIITVAGFVLVLVVLGCSAAEHAFAGADYPAECNGLTPDECSAYFQEVSQ